MSLPPPSSRAGAHEQGHRATQIAARCRDAGLQCGEIKRIEHERLIDSQPRS